MSLEALVTKYITLTEEVLNTMKRTEDSSNITEDCIDNILSYAKAYFEDAKYYKSKKRLETSLTSIAYCEGLLDALRLLGAVKFEWPAKPQRKK
jgi:FAD synthetase